MKPSEIFNDGSLRGWWKPFKVAIRRHTGLEVKPEAEQIDGKVFLFRFGWDIEDDDTRYPGEEAWIPDDSRYPADGPTWISSGDLKSAAIEIGGAA